MTQNDFQNYVADYFLFPFFEKDRIEQKEKLFDEVFEREARVKLRENGVLLDPEGFIDYLKTTRKDIENLTREEFKEVVVDYYFLKSKIPTQAVKNIIPQMKAKVKTISEISAKDAKIIAVYKESIKTNGSDTDVVGLMGMRDDLGVNGTPKDKTDKIRKILDKCGAREKRQTASI